MSSMNNYQSHLIAVIHRSTEEAASAWLDTSLEKLNRSDDLENELLTRSAMARRKLGKDALGDQPDAIETAAGPLDISHWSASDAGRVALLLEASKLDPAPPSKWVDMLYRHGDEPERIAIVQALVLLPSPESLKAIALETGRCNSLWLYSALALKNPYISVWYDEQEFNQVVLKSLFTGLPIDRIVGLRKRANRELARMCEEYADERMAAGRSVPSDIWLAMALHASEHGEQLMLKSLDHEDPQHRYYAAIALGWRCDINSKLTSALQQRLKNERENVVRETIEYQLKISADHSGS